MSGDIENLVQKLVFQKDAKIRKEIRKRAEAQGVFVCSTQKLYEARVQNQWENLTVPAINIRTLTFDTARSIFRQVIKKKVGAFIFELARSEISYTDQDMSEYVPVILAAAIKEGFRGPLFFQGDHFQANAKKYFNPEKKEEEVSALKKLIKDSIEAGVYNIDIDTSTLVSLEKPDIKEQQKYNSLLTAELTSYIRSLQSQGITISVGGEVGEIGGRNSIPEDIRVFMEEYNKHLLELKIKPGLIKIAVQTGATHGGVVLPSGEIKKVEIDFNTLRKLSEEVRKFSMAGAVQHGASTLPEEYFDEFPKTGAIEIHLATAFQNIVYDFMPESLREKIYDWLKKDYNPPAIRTPLAVNPVSEEKEEILTQEQFLYKARKKALGPFKKEIWSIPEENKDKIAQVLEEKFSILFEKLGVINSLELIKKYYPFN